MLNFYGLCFLFLPSRVTGDSQEVQESLDCKEYRSVTVMNLDILTQ